MARRRWPASRARLHFGDFAPPKPAFELRSEEVGETPDPEKFGSPEADAWRARLLAAMDRKKLVRPVDVVVWTAMREDSLEIALPDGRCLIIGGKVKDYGDEYADPWTYNDVIVTEADGTIRILSYPEDVFPFLHGSDIGAIHDRAIYVFGCIDGKRHPDRSSGVAVWRLDMQSYEIAEVSVAEAPALHIYPGSGRRDGNRIVFPVPRRYDSDPELSVAFDLNTHSWGRAFLDPRPRQ
jgi:hypothetical protein